MDRKKNLQLGEVPEWGPNFVITFETKIVSFVSHGDLLHFTASGKSCCNEGDRTPVVLTLPNKRLQVKTFFNGNPDQGFTSRGLLEQKWYNIEISQKSLDNDTSKVLCTKKDCTNNR